MPVVVEVIMAVVPYSRGLTIFSASAVPNHLSAVVEAHLTAMGNVIGSCDQLKLARPQPTSGNVIRHCL